MLAKLDAPALSQELKAQKAFCIRAGLGLPSSWGELGLGWVLLARRTPSRAPAATAWALGQVPGSSSRPERVGLFLTALLSFSELHQM